jgi:hypothetical protein
MAFLVSLLPRRRAVNTWASASRRNAGTHGDHSPIETIGDIGYKKYVLFQRALALLIVLPSKTNTTNTTIKRS